MICYVKINLNTYIFLMSHESWFGMKVYYLFHIYAVICYYKLAIANRKNIASPFPYCSHILLDMRLFII